MTEDRENTEQQDVEAHGRFNVAPEDAQDVEAHSIGSRHAPSEQPQDVEGHVYRVGRGENEPPAKPGTEGRDDDVEGDAFRGAI
jgi:hypothetical protein